MNDRNDDDECTHVWKNQTIFNSIFTVDFETLHTAIGHVTSEPSTCRITKIEGNSVEMGKKDEIYNPFICAIVAANGTIINLFLFWCVFFSLFLFNFRLLLRVNRMSCDFSEQHSDTRYAIWSAANAPRVKSTHTPRVHFCLARRASKLLAAFSHGALEIGIGIVPSWECVSWTLFDKRRQFTDHCSFNKHLCRRRHRTQRLTDE